MKKLYSKFTVFGLMMMVSTFMHAQNYNPGPNFGVKGGLNLSQLFVDQVNIEDESMKLGYHFGLFSKIPFSNSLSIQPEILYTNTGSRITYGGTDLANLLGIEPGEVRFNLNYVQLPVALAINIGALNIHAGPYLSYLVSANVSDLKWSDLNSSEVQELNTNDFNRFDYGLMGGIGVDVQGFTIGARYNYGLREIGKTGVVGNLTNNSRNAVAQLYIGFGI
jgi:hypothetical protein